MGACAKLCVLTALLSWAEAFYLPGLAATNFCEKEVEEKSAKGTPCRVREITCNTTTLRCLSVEPCVCARQQVGLHGDYSTV